jgi:hypothetical protein
MPPTDIILPMNDRSGWRCPLCGALAASGPEHLRSEHGLGGSGEDRFGLRQAARPRPPRPARRRPRAGGAIREPTESPPRPVPLPPDAAVLRLVCESLDGLDAARLQARLADLAGVDSVAVDLYERTVDLFLDRRRTAPPHLVALAMERVGLPVVTAELHRAPPAGAKLGEQTRLLVVL